MMPRGRISIGVDDATGQPATAPRGPYITDEDDGTAPRRKPRAPAAGGAKHSPPTTKRASGGKNPTSRRKGPARP
jgi:hypothetical protein